MLCRARESTFRTLSVPDPQTLRIRISSSRGTFRPAAHLFAALSILDPSLSSLPLLQRASLVIVRGRMPGIPAAVLLQEQRRSPGLGVTSLRKPSPDLAYRRKDIPNSKRPRDLETGYQRFRLQRYSQ
jgi:hypothetical protein